MQEQASAGFWLSPQQKFAWRLQQEALGKSARAVYLISMEGQVDAGRVQECLREMVSRHEILRTVFRRQTGMKVPFQVVLETAAVDWEVADLSAVSLPERKSKLDALFGAEQNRELNIEAGPALRALFITLGQNQFALILSLPSLCADARSLEILTRELGMLCSGQRDKLAEPFRYVQFAQWQADLIESEEADAKQGREFWDVRPALMAPALPLEKRQRRRFSRSRSRSE